VLGGGGGGGKNPFFFFFWFVPRIALETPGFSIFSGGGRRHGRGDGLSHFFRWRKKKPTGHFFSFFQFFSRDFRGLPGARFSSRDAVGRDTKKPGQSGVSGFKGPGPRPGLGGGDGCICGDWVWWGTGKKNPPGAGAGGGAGGMGPPRGRLISPKCAAFSVAGQMAGDGKQGAGSPGEKKKKNNAGASAGRFADHHRRVFIHPENKGRNGMGPA